MPNATRSEPSRDTHTWQRVSDLFNAALERAPEERDVFLRDECGGDETMRERVEAMLAADARAGTGFMAQPRFSLWRTDAASEITDDEAVDRRVGSYQLVSSLGRGGMGEVFLAARVDGGFEQQVAVKLLKRGLDTDEVIRRFRAEQQILAGLNHPNVARLLDGGTTDDGLPYLVMEHVEGQRIDAFCAARRLSVAARVALLRKVCDAVHYAHQNLVVHRDLKPSNILVTAEGVPKLLDFGIAKLLDDDARGVATRTALVVPMTPQYASPEQIRGGVITTATDVYTLGLLLYELLTGAQPYRADTLSPVELEHVVCDTEPPRPSAAVRAAPPGAGLPGSAQRWARELAGDLDTIVLRALAKDPERRYASVEQLSEDLRRYLEDEPVRARPDAFLYRTGKFVRRNALGVTLGSALALALVLFTALMAVQRLRIGRQNEEIVRQSGIIAEESDRAQEAMGFLIGILRVPDPTRGTGAKLTVREALDAAAESLRLTIHDRPLTRAALLDTVGRVYTNLELLDEAEPLLEEALATRRSQRTAPLVAESLHNLAILRDRQGRSAEAEALRREAIDIQRAVFPDGHPDLARGLNNLAQSLRRQRKLDEAESLASQALAMQERLLGGEHVDVARTLNTLATLARHRGERDKAEVLYRRSIAIRRAQVGENDAGLAKTLNNLAQLLVDRGALDEAVLLHERALTMRQRLYAGDHRDRVTSLNNLGLTLALSGASGRGLGWLDKALAEGERLTLSPKFLAVLRKNRGLALLASGDAEAALEEAVWALEALREKGSAAQVAEAESLWAACRTSLGHFGEAEAVLVRGYETLADSLGDGAWQTRLARGRLADAYDAVGRTEEAARYREARPE